ncbi:hypothetical protein HDE_12888 [Halotydeus destructor]|nr:hypothetical protein HDE_12888 [Halotydeus destructor]
MVRKSTLFLISVTLIVINGQDLIHPVVKCIDSNCNSAQIQFKAQNREFKFTVIRNEEYKKRLAQNYRSAMLADARNYYYSQGEDFSTLRIHEDKVEGIFISNGEDYEIVYDEKENKHRLHHAGTKTGAATCGTDFSNWIDEEADRPKAARLQSSNEPPTKHFIEYLLVHDEAMLQHFSETKLIQKSHHIVALMNHHISKLDSDFHIVLKDVIVWKKDPVDRGDTIYDLRDSFAEYATSHLYQDGAGYDIAHLLTGQLFKTILTNGGFLAGLTKSVLCNGNATAINHYKDKHDKPTLFLDMVKVMLHELVHSLEIYHSNGQDGIYNASCYCGHNLEPCLMDAIPQGFEWSNCTKGALEINKAIEGRYHCLLNDPNAAPSVASTPKGEVFHRSFSSCYSSKFGSVVIFTIAY